MRTRVIGHYVFILDDDDYVTDSDFVKDLKKICDEHQPDVVICKGYINGNVLPTLPVYQTKMPIRGCIGSPNFVVTNELYQRFAQHWCQEVSKHARAADFHFIFQVFQSEPKPKIYWWDRKVFWAAIGGAQAGDYKGKLHEKL
jgi:hypothetical protein